MSQIIAVHSFRGGTGKSNISANLAAVLAQQGQRVGVMDTDIQSPGIHALFDLDDTSIRYSLNDYLWDRCDITETAYDMTRRLGSDIPGQLHIVAGGGIFVVPSSLKTGEIARILREGYDIRLLSDGLHKLIDALCLDVLLIDTHPGLNQETLLAIAIADTLVVVLRPDKQDYQGTGVTIDVAQRLEIGRVLLVVNQVPAVFDPAEVRQHIRQAYGCEVAGVLPHCDEMMALGSSGIFVLQYPDHPLTHIFRQIAAAIVG